MLTAGSGAGRSVFDRSGQQEIQGNVKATEDLNVLVSADSMSFTMLSRQTSQLSGEARYLVIKRRIWVVVAQEYASSIGFRQSRDSFHSLHVEHSGPAVVVVKCTPSQNRY
jgi:hypothetical protein